ncbi:MAG: threonine synthase, partial [Clostridia bacterium]|nr:threonine synthase [Clostridia bacterium]
AKKMGVPINKLICASNSNNVLTDFINSGTYDRNRKFYTTISPSMDILISSNLERLIFELSGNDDTFVKSVQNSLSNTGTYTVPDSIKEKIKDLFYADFCSDEETLDTIKSTFCNYGYLCDTHTAVALGVYNKYVKNTGDKLPCVIASTASPYKFAKDVLKAVSDEKAEGNFETVSKLSEVTNTEVPLPIKSLENAKVRFKEVYEKEKIASAVFDSLKI